MVDAMMSFEQVFSGKGFCTDQTTEGLLFGVW